MHSILQSPLYPTPSRELSNLHGTGASASAIKQHIQVLRKTQGHRETDGAEPGTAPPATKVKARGSRAKSTGNEGKATSTPRKRKAAAPTEVGQATEEEEMDETPTKMPKTSETSD
jgi:SOS-response transcriptional repressor LexA